MDKLTINTYDQLAHEYDQETADFWEKFPKKTFDKFTESINDKKVLDVGSGPGRDGAILNEQELKVTCLDASRAMVELCLEKGLEAVVGDFDHMPFDDQSLTRFGPIPRYFTCRKPLSINR